jgi:hypothetical protein
MLPNFLVVGAGRSGTTSLHHYLGQHPEIYLPGVKSPSYFYCHRPPISQDNLPEPVTRDYFVCDTGRYQALFDGVRSESAVGEVSPAYLASMRAVEHIAKTIPSARLVIILRNPIERFYARYVARRRDGLELAAAVEDLIESERKQPLVREETVGTYLSAGFCSHFIEAYMARFPAEQLFVSFFDDLAANAHNYMRSLFEFLEVCPDFEPDLSLRRNVSGGYVRNPVLRRLWTKSAAARRTIRPYIPKDLRDRAFQRITQDVVAMPLGNATRRQLADIYRPEIEKLQLITGRDLGHWLHSPG